MSEEIAKILSDGLGLAVKAIGDNMDKVDFNASGNTKRSLMFEVSREKDTIKGRITAFEPVLYSEKGKPPANYERSLTDAIYEWMPYRWIAEQLDESGKYAVANLIARRISKLGTKLWRDKGSKGQKRDVYTSVLDDAVLSFGEQLKTLISENIQTTFKEAFAV